MNLLALNAANYDDHPGWAARLPFLAQLVNQTNADVLALSEVRYSENNKFNDYAAAYFAAYQVTPPPVSSPSMADHLLAFLNGLSGFSQWQMTQQFFAEYPNNSREGLATFTRLPLVRSGCFSIPSGGTDSNSRGTLWTDIQATPQTVVRVFNTHFSLDLTAQQGDASEMLKQIAAFSGPAAMVGDLNAEPTDPAITQLTSGGLTDLWAQLSTTPRGETFPAPSLGDIVLHPNPRTKRIDYIFANAALLPSASKIVRAPMNGQQAACDGATVFVSDHVGVLGTFNCP